MEIVVSKTDTITFSPPVEKDKDPEIIAAMSMAVTEIKGYYQTLFRQVQKSEAQAVPESVLAFASGNNGVDFKRSGEIPVRPEKSLLSHDRLAVEDPTIVKLDDKYYVFHSGVEPKPGGKEGVLVSIQVVTGENLQTLNQEKKTILTPNDVKDILGDKVDMVKEPEFFLGKDGLWRIIYEHTGRGKSEIAIAESPSLLGPYRNHRPLLQTRENMWDNQHTSPGPLLMTSKGDILMFYNGRGPKSPEDHTPSWAIGSVIIDAKTGVVSNRSQSPIIRPPEEIGPGNQLIAFGNSIVSQESSNRLYYTVADKRSKVATLAIDGL